MNALIDTNVVVDVILDRKPFSKEANAIFDLIAENKIFAYISSKSILDLYYILRGYYHNHNEALKRIVKIIDLLYVLDIIDLDLLKALGDGLRDYEDDVIRQTAIRYKMDYIITRNKKDFKNERIKIVSPKEFIDIYEEYEKEELG